MRTAFRALSGVVFLLLSIPGWPGTHTPRQDSTALSLVGKVRDAQTGEAVAYAAVGVTGTPVGTVSDTAGNFSLRVPVQYLSDTLLVSLLGYAPYRAFLRSLPAGQPLLIRLAQKSIPLPEAVVAARRLTVRDILERAIGQLPVTYPAAPYAAEGFYRETRSKDGRYKSLLEASVRLYNTHNRPFKGIEISRRAALQQVRSSREAEQYAFRDYNALYTLLYAEFIRMPRFERLDKRVPKAYPSLFDTLNARPVYVILVENAPHLTRLFIDVENYGVARVEDYKTFASPTDGKLSNRFWLRYISVVNGYEYREGKYYLNYLSFQGEGETHNPVTGKTQPEGILFKELFIRNDPAGNLSPVTPEENMSRYTPLTKQRQPYNSTFWKGFWGLTAHPIHPLIVADLGGPEDLQKQFAGL